MIAAARATERESVPQRVVVEDEEHVTGGRSASGARASEMRVAVKSRKV